MTPEDHITKIFSRDELANKLPVKPTRWIKPAKEIVSTLKNNPESIPGFYTGVTEERMKLDAEKQQSALLQQVRKEWKGQEIHSGKRFLEATEEHPGGYWIFFSTQKDFIP